MLRGWMLKGKDLRMGRCNCVWISGQRLASSYMAMALTQEYNLEHFENATSNILRKSWNGRPLLRLLLRRYHHAIASNTTARIYGSVRTSLDGQTISPDLT